MDRPASPADRPLDPLPAFTVAIADILGRLAAELALFAGVGFLIFEFNDLSSTSFSSRARLARVDVYTRDRARLRRYYVFNKARLHRDLGAGVGRSRRHRRRC